MFNSCVAISEKVRMISMNKTMPLGSIVNRIYNFPEEMDICNNINSIDISNIISMTSIKDVVKAIKEFEDYQEAGIVKKCLEEMQIEDEENTLRY